MIECQNLALMGPNGAVLSVVLTERIALHAVDLKLLFLVYIWDTYTLPVYLHVKALQ